MNKQKLHEEISKTEAKLNKLKEELSNLPEEDFETYKHKNKEFRIYKWTKPIKDFKYPKGFRMTEFQEFVDLYDSGKIELKTWDSYFVKHFSKIQQKREYCFASCYLDWDSNLVSYYSSLADSSGYGRVVCVRGKNKK